MSTFDSSTFHLSFDDEFNSFTSSPNGSTGWQTTYYFGGRSLPSNGEQEYYSDSTVGVNPFSVQNGELTITAAPGSNPEGLAYNSGLITTEGDFTQTYGYFEIRAEVPAGQGMWPGFWLLPADKSWPPEIDVLEAFGATNANGEGGANQVHVNAISHALTDTGNSSGGGEWVTIPDNIYTGYHTYGVDWEHDYITFYIDGTEVYQVATPSDMNKPMYMLANVAVGGPWVGNATGEAGQMKIDYIRAYSSDTNVHTVALQTVSSPDSVNTTPTSGSGVSEPPPSGDPSITVRVSEDAWNGDAQFVVLVDGQRIGGVQTTTASHALGQWQDITVSGTIGAGPHTVDVQFINDGWGGSFTSDRNLYVQSVSIGGEHLSGATAFNNAANGAARIDPGAAVMMINGTTEFKTGDTSLDQSTITVRVAEDAWNGDAQFTVLVDGQQIGGVQTATASHALGQWQDITLTSNFGAGAHTVDVNFINDGWGGTAATDRNLYVQSIAIGGETVAGTAAHNNAANGSEAADPNAAVMMVNGTSEFTTADASAPSVPTTTSTPLYLRVSEDAWNGDAQFNVFVDGQQIGGVQTTTASHSLGEWQDIALDGNFGIGPHTIDVSFINDGWGGDLTLDRNLYVKAVSLNGETILGSAASDNAANGSSGADPTAAVMMVNGTSEFKITGTNISTTSTLTLHVSEDSWNGDAQFVVTVDGHQVGGVQTATASHAQGQWQDITLTGNFGLTGPDKIDLTFLNDGWGGNSNMDRNLYVQSVDVNGQIFSGNAAVNNAANGNASEDPHTAVMMINGTAEFAINHTTGPSDFWHAA